MVLAQTWLVGLDWGTSSLRAFRIGANGGVLERREGPWGILAVEGGDFESRLRQFVGDWLAAAPLAPVLASGMVTSRQGWVEVPYLPCPAGIGELAAALHPLRLADGRILHFVPGLACRQAGDAPEVMRGEETQIAGALASGPTSCLFVLPGTHSKWAEVENGRVQRFSTFMTGELYALLCRHSILGRGMAGEAFQASAFEEGVRAGHAPGKATGGLLHRLFGVRTRGLAGELAPEAAASFLSGLLIGSEIREAEGMYSTGRAVDLIGSFALATRYGRAFALLGRPSTIWPEDLAARGHFALARAAGLVG
ncbi:putative 2-dehydro-3-deoxygalactonokinase DgoK1 [bacterium HR40]|nr:putative 2-dehydro-3-deoxygalactonokinase DgoK1 [bacterium HR40]